MIEKTSESKRKVTKNRKKPEENKPKNSLNPKLGIEQRSKIE